MLDRMLNHADLIEMLDDLARKRRLVGPVRRGERFLYEEVTDPRQLDLLFTYCVFGPRSYLFPPVETLFTFESENGAFRAKPMLDARPLALIGVHPCDLHAIALLDHVFGHEHADEHYLTRRRHTFIVGMDCGRPCTEGVFCADMGCHDTESGFDLMLHLLGEKANGHARYGVRFGTPEGRQWVLYGRRSEVPTLDDERAFDRAQREKAAAFSRRIKTPAEELPALLDRSYDSLLWEATARRCYSCGSCNLSCPTCYCFNILDDLSLDGSQGTRRREWDGCQIKSFATVAGPHNFRPKAASRLRHRIYRKAKWIREKTGLPGCVGCARCDRACTAKINSVEIYNQLAEEV
ncbi:Anaerobic sulfite reductase subunit A [Phycisphaerae bacterium RAS2]|nr:Anaerobic sulfite reductase subunit A [Phycisphaerae bacterium RAS2]